MFSAILNVLAIIVLAVVAGFIILLLVDLILGCVDGKRGVIFFRNRKNTDKDNQILLQYNKDINVNDSYFLQNNNQDLALDFDKQYEKENEEVKNNNVDLEKAEAEQKLIEEKNKVEEVVEPEIEQNDEFTFINKISPEIEKEIEEEQKASNQELNVEDEDDEEDDFDFDFDDEDEDDDDDKSIEEILNAIRERNMKARNKFLAEAEDEPEFGEDEIEKTTEEIINEAEEDKAEVEETLQEVENIENTAQVSEEIEKLNAIIKELNEKIEAEQAKNAELEEKSKQDLENLKKQFEEKVVVETEKEEITEESLQTLEVRLAELLDRQKQNEKDLKANKKEYLPLARIDKTLESDKTKLRRKEAIVAKKKMLLLGVNNYVADEEKEKKLAEDLDLLEGLRMSVSHCEEVMAANKDRYPVLKKTNEILTRNAEHLEEDIKALQEKIAKAKEVLNGNGDDTTDTTSTNE